MGSAQLNKAFALEPTHGALTTGEASSVEAVFNPGSRLATESHFSHSAPGLQLELIEPATGTVEATIQLPVRSPRGSNS